ncbi:hypothetical protein CRUP_034525, partial [Coryphaenoides rupestris]
NAVTIAVSSRVLFNMEKEQRIYEQQGMEDYVRFQVEHEALEAVNARLRELYPDSEEVFDVVLVTNNHAHVGLRLINTINHYQNSTFTLCSSSGDNSTSGVIAAKPPLTAGPFISCREWYT